MSTVGAAGTPAGLLTTTYCCVAATTRCAQDAACAAGKRLGCRCTRM